MLIRTLLVFIISSRYYVQYIRLRVCVSIKYKSAVYHGVESEL